MAHPKSRVSKARKNKRRTHHKALMPQLGICKTTGEPQFEHHGVLVTFKAGVPIEVDGVRIDYLSPASLGSQLEETLDHPPVSDGLAIVPVEVLIYMKLFAKRRKDQVDVIEVIKAGADIKQVRLYLEQHAADLLPLFEELANESLVE